MYCPNCGAINSGEQAFCRGCGMNLDAVADALLNQRPPGIADKLDLEERRLELFGKIAFTGFGTVIFLAIAAIVFVIVTKMVLSGTQPWVGGILAAFVVFAGLALGYVFWRETLQEKRSMLKKQGRANLADPGTTDLQMLNESSIEPAVSVTEHTTRKLAREPRPDQ